MATSKTGKTGKSGSAAKGQTPPPYAKKAKKNEKAILDSIDRENLRTLFDDRFDVQEVIQISFDDDLGEKKSENVVTVRPQEFVKTGDRISREIVNDFSKGKAEYRANIKTADGVKPIVTRVSFAYQSMDVLAESGFTSMDKEVHDAIVSLYAAGNKVFSPAMVYRTMAGKSESVFVPHEKLKEVSQSIYKCMGSIIAIDASEEAGFYDLETTYHENLIYAKSVTLKTKGWEVSAFMMLEEPILYKYAKLKRQLFSVPLQVLDTPPNKTNDVIVLQGYLVRVVETLRRKGKGAPSEVTYATLYEMVGCEGATKQKLLRIRNNIKIILDYWVEIGYITGYREISRNRAKYALVLEVPQEAFVLEQGKLGQSCQ